MRTLFLSAVAVFSSFTSLPAALVIYYPLDETSGNVAFDAADTGGNQNATSASAVADWQTTGGILGGGLRFSPTGVPHGQTDVNEALIYNAASILTGPPFTITLWFNTTDVNSYNHAAVYLGTPTSNTAYYAVGMNGTLQPVQIARGTNIATITSATPANDGQWHQMTAVYSATNSRQLYVDGRLSGTSTTDVASPAFDRFGIGALTRSSQTDAYSGLLDEIGLFDTALSAQEVALLNAFPRYDDVRLDDTDYILALSVFDSQSGSIATGDWTWFYATGLSGPLGTTGTVDGVPYVVLDSSGNGLAAIPEPSVGALALLGLVACARRRR